MKSFAKKSLTLRFFRHTVYVSLAILAFIHWATDAVTSEETSTVGNSVELLMCPAHFTHVMLELGYELKLFVD